MTAVTCNRPGRECERTPPPCPPVAFKSRVTSLSIYVFATFSYLLTAQTHFVFKMYLQSVLTALQVTFSGELAAPSVVPPKDGERPRPRSERVTGREWQRSPRDAWVSATAHTRGSHKAEQGSA